MRNIQLRDGVSVGWQRSKEENDKRKKMTKRRKNSDWLKGLAPMAERLFL